MTTAVIVGASGAVGEDLRRIVAERDLPVDEVRLVASARSVGRRLSVRGVQVEILPLEPEVFDGAAVAFFSAGGAISREWAPVAAARGAVVVDNSSAWRMHPEVPLVDADVNAEAVREHPIGIVANPNCTTLTITPVLAVLRDLFGLAAITPTSFQAAGGSGQRGMDELAEQSAKLIGDRELLRAGGRAHALPAGEVFPHPLAFNVVPQCMGFDEDGYTVEERKLQDEPRKILGLPGLASHPTCVRVPVMVGHSVSVRAVCERPVELDAFRAALAAAPGVSVLDDPAAATYPTPLELVGTDGVFVGRIRTDLADSNALLFWAVADNLRKGAALNAVQIGEVLLGA
ncbi:MAG TPA: aspartate-semialdehyde dehydrogenase [Actinomycetota bacterium]|jgi:aspartate-semialdehyde dehydrogenase|nr:aspartate-semialdehyde dehydrogenase [Actinomycetota bacterium]